VTQGDWQSLNIEIGGAGAGAPPKSRFENLSLRIEIVVIVVVVVVGITFSEILVLMSNPEDFLACFQLVRV